MKRIIEKVKYTEKFWIIAVILVLSWLFLKYFYFDMDTVGAFFLLRSGYFAPLIIPAIFFYLFVKTKTIDNFEKTLNSIVIWSLWGFFYFMFLNFGWFQKGTGYGPSGLQKVYSILLFILVYLVAFPFVSRSYVGFCRHILEKEYSQAVKLKRKMLWNRWSFGFISMLLLGLLYAIIREHIIFPEIFQELNRDRDLSLKNPFFLMTLRAFIDDLVGLKPTDMAGLSLQWLILTLPATLKIDTILSKEN